MIERIIAASLENRFLTISLFVAIAAIGVWAAVALPVDAIPDLTDVQVILLAEWPGQNPEVMEDQVTYPIASAMLNVARVKDVRTQSFFGASFVFVIFEDGTDLYWARSRVQEFVDSVKLPEGPEVRLGPDATGLGWVYMYTLEDTLGRYDLGELRALQDGFVAPLLQGVPGVSEVASVGGAVRRYEIIADPERLLALGIDVPQLARAVRKANTDVGGMSLDIAEREYMVRGRGYIRSIRDLENVVLRADGGTPVRVRDVAEVTLAPDSVRGIADRDGTGEVVAGIVVMRYGENAREVIERVRDAVDRMVEPGLPEGVVLRTAYDRSPLIDRAIGTLLRSFAQELLVIALVCFMFLLHVRSALVAFVTLPLGALATFIVMKLVGINANIMSLAGIAIAFGTMVDASIVMVENVHKRLEQGGASRKELVALACKEVGPGLFFSLLVVTISNLPIFALEDQAGRLFRPLAWTNTLAMGAACLISITLIPPLVWIFVRGKIAGESSNPLSRLLLLAYGPVVRFTVRRRWLVCIGAAALVVTALGPLNRLGSEFMPPLEEGDLLYMPTSVPGLAPGEARRALRMQDALLAGFPEVRSVLGKAGRSSTATDTAPLEMVETTAMLRDEETWPERLVPRGWVAERATLVRPDLAGDVASMVRPAVNDRIRSKLVQALTRERLSFRDPKRAGPPSVLTPEEEERYETARPALQRKLLDGIGGRIVEWSDELIVTRLEELLRTRKEKVEEGAAAARLRALPARAPSLVRTTFDELTRDEMQRTITQPGMPNWFLMPIQTRIGMMTTGMRGTLGLKVFGPNYARTQRLAVDLENVLGGMRETVSALAERAATGGWYLDAEIDREACARFGLNVDEVQRIVRTAVGGMRVTETVEGRYRFPVAVRYPRERRDDPERLSRILVRLPAGSAAPPPHAMAGMTPVATRPVPQVVTLGQLVTFRVVNGPMMIRSENSLLVVYLPVEFDGASLGEYVARADREIRAAIEAGKLDVPAGYTWRWSGQYEIMERTNERLMLIIPLTIAIIFFVLYLHFRRLSNSLIVLFGTLLFAPVGALWLTWILGYSISTAWVLGLILLLGLAAETGVIMLVYLDNAVEARRKERGSLTVEDLEAAIEEGAIQRVRPKVMTVATDLLGILPLLWATGAGAMTLERMAAPLVGGIASSLLLTLCVIPAAYRIVHGFRLGKR